MLKLITSLILAGLFWGSGFNFFNSASVDNSYLAAGSDLVLAPTRIVNDSFGLKTTAKSIVVVDKASGAILYHKNPQAVLPIASITKLVNALVFLDTNPDWDKVVEINQADLVAGNRWYFFAGEKVKLSEVFNVMLVASANEAALTLARYSGVDDYVTAMNNKAAALGMTASHFADPSGLNVENVSTATDLVKLATTAFSKTEIISAVTAESFDYKIINNSRRGHAVNTDNLLNSFLNADPYSLAGAKTGYLDEAGYCLLTEVKNKNKGTLMIAILGATSPTDRWQEAKGLVDWVNNNYNWPTEN
ncbi:MAG: serine hydrolase [Patescibacteria group bacterium]|nr:serine hydrolase [Patescibacteria group bacterium]